MAVAALPQIPSISLNMKDCRILRGNGYQTLDLARLKQPPVLFKRQQVLREKVGDRLTTIVQPYGFTFDASRANAIYDGSHVVPANYAAYIFIYAGE